MRGADALTRAATARWLLPAAFVSCMAMGAAFGTHLPYAETMIALSVLVAGLAVALRAHLPVAVGALLVGLFALFHGHAHLTELPAGVAASAFALGMLCATALLHAAGVFTALGVARMRSWLPRALGGAIALAGAWLLLA